MFQANNQRQSEPHIYIRKKVMIFFCESRRKAWLIRWDPFPLSAGVEYIESVRCFAAGPIGDPTK